MFTRDVRVMPSDVGCDGRIKLRSLLNYFQDTAALAVEDVEGTTTQLLSRGYAWVMVKYELEFHGELPKLDEAFTIATFHDVNHGYNTLRMFQAGTHKKFLSAKTSWLLVDVKTGRPVKPLAHIPGIASRDTQDIPPGFTDIPHISDITSTASFTVKYHDTDANGHVNNAAYFEWLQDLFHERTPEIPEKICASFRSGAKLGEIVTLNLQNDMLCNVIRQGVNKPCAEFLCKWRVESV